SWSAIENKWKERWADFDTQWKEREREFNARRRGSSFDLSSRNETFAQLKAEYDAATEKLQNDQDEEIGHMRLVRSSGFSLDPSTDFDGLAGVLAEAKFATLLERAGYPVEELRVREPLIKFMRAAINGTSEEALRLAGVDLAKFKAAARDIKVQAEKVAKGRSPFDIDARQAVVPLLQIVEELKGKDASASFVAEVLNDL